MTEPPFLFRLAERISTGAERIPAELRQRCLTVIHAGQQPDGGWAGREGDSDLYYTSFALRSLLQMPLVAHFQ